MPKNLVEMWATLHGAIEGLQAIERKMEELGRRSDSTKIAYAEAQPLKDIKVDFIGNHAEGAELTNLNPSNLDEITEWVMNEFTKEDLEVAKAIQIPSLLEQLQPEESGGRDCRAGGDPWCEDERPKAP